MGKAHYHKAGTSHWLIMALLFTVALAQAEVVPWPFAGLAVARDEALRISCANNLKQIELAAKLFASNTGHFPLSFQEVTNYLDSPKRILCPANDAHSPPAVWADFDWNEVDYELVPGADPANPTTQLC